MRVHLIWPLALCLSVLVAPAAIAQGRGLEVEYTVKVADIPGQLFHVTTDIRNINQPALDLSLPVWFWSTKLSSAPSAASKYLKVVRLQRLN